MAEQILKIAVKVLSVAAGAAMLYYVWIYYIQTMIRTWKEERQPTLTTGATVAGRTANAENVLYSSFFNRDGGDVFYLIFHTEEGLELVLRVPRDKYFNTEDGARGELEYQGSRCWRFEPER